mgnify:CR=1 FL=1
MTKVWVCSECSDVLHIIKPPKLCEACGSAFAWRDWNGVVSIYSLGPVRVGRGKE